jgi:hypothetical protein
MYSWIMLSAMFAESNTDSIDAKRRSGHVWYFSAVGLVAAAAIIASAFLPQAIAGAALAVAALVVGFIDFVARRVGAAPGAAKLRAAAMVYYVVLGLVLIGSLIVVWVVIRNSDAMWLAWVLAGVVFVVTFSGTWAVGGRVNQKTAVA